MAVAVAAHITLGLQRFSLAKHGNCGAGGVAPLARLLLKALIEIGITIMVACSPCYVPAIVI